MGLLIDLIPNSPTNIIRIVWQTVRRITNEFLGVEVKSYTFLVVFTLMSPSALHTSTTASPGCQCIIDGI